MTPKKFFSHSLGIFASTTQSAEGLLFHPVAAMDLFSSNVRPRYLGQMKKE